MFKDQVTWQLTSPEGQGKIFMSVLICLWSKCYVDGMPLTEMHSCLCMKSMDNLAKMSKGKWKQLAAVGNVSKCQTAGLWMGYIKITWHNEVWTCQLWGHTWKSSKLLKRYFMNILWVFNDHYICGQSVYLWLKGSLVWDRFQLVICRGHNNEYLKAHFKNIFN